MASTMLRSLLSRLPAVGPRYGIQTNFYRECSNDVSQRIRELIQKDKVVIFMKGTPKEPRCGFSSRVCSIMAYHGVKFQHYDVLRDQELRQGIKDFTKWPTIPQVFLDGIFLGGHDILKSKHVNGELVQDLKSIGITSTGKKISGINSETNEDKDI